MTVQPDGKRMRTVYHRNKKEHFKKNIYSQNHKIGQEEKRSKD